VGRVSLDWVDQDRAEVYSSNVQDRRALVAWIWYPATPDPDAERAAYLPEPWAPSGQFLGLDVAGLLSHAVAGAPVAGEQPRYPALVLSPSGFPPLLLAAIAEELASHGYVVVGVNHTYETPVTVFADGRAVAVNPDAQAGVLGPQTGPYQERFRQRERCATTRRPISPRSPTGSSCSPVTRPESWPALQVLAEHPEFALSGAEKSITFDGWRTVHRRARPAYTVQIRGATHVSFMDVPLLPLADGSPVKAMLATAQIEPRRMWRITCDVLLAFFATHLDQAAAIPPVLAGPSGAYPELTFGPP
jgi:hypothetical protein